MSNKTTQIKQEAISIYQRLQSSDGEAAKKDFEYFMRLIELAEEYRKEG